MLTCFNHSRTLSHAGGWPSSGPWSRTNFAHRTIGVDIIMMYNLPLEHGRLQSIAKHIVEMPKF